MLDDPFVDLTEFMDERNNSFSSSVSGFDAARLCRLCSSPWTLYPPPITSICRASVSSVPSVLTMLNIINNCVAFILCFLSLLQEVVLALKTRNSHALQLLKLLLHYIKSRLGVVFLQTSFFLANQLARDGDFCLKCKSIINTRQQTIAWQSISRIVDVCMRHLSWFW